MTMNIIVLCNVKMDVAGSSETFVNGYQATRWHIPEENNLQVQRSFEPRHLTKACLASALDKVQFQAP
jgi:hypothetical protein